MWYSASIMASDHEMAPTASQPELPEDIHAEALRRTRLDNAGFTQYRAELAFKGSDPDWTSYPKPHEPYKRPSRRGGRSYAEPSDNDIDEHMQVPYERLSDEELAERRAILDGPGHTLAAETAAKISKQLRDKANRDRQPREQAALEIVAGLRREQKLHNV